MGGDYVALCVAIEELARVDSSIAITLEAGVSLGAMPIYRFGSEELKNEWLPRLTSGEMLGAFGLTEPGAGSDAGGTATTATLVDGNWVINGSKAFITNSGTEITGLITVTAVTGYADDGSKEISSILIPTGTSRPHRRPGRTRRWVGTPRTPMSSRSTMCGCRRRIWWGSEVAATPSSCGSWTRAGSRLQPWQRVWLKVVWTSP